MSLIPTHKAGHKLQKIIKKVRRHLFVFVTNRDLTATNNGSERALRPCAVYRKITNGFRSQWGAALYADIRQLEPFIRPADLVDQAQIAEILHVNL